MKMRAALAVLTIVLAVAGCQRAVDGAADPALNQQEIERYRLVQNAATALTAALERMAERPVMRYTNTAKGTFTVTVARTAQGFGQGVVRGAAVKAVFSGHQLFVVAGAKRWVSLGLQPETARRYAGQWTRATPGQVGFDPARGLTPKAVADDLRSATDQALDARNLPQLDRLPDATMVYRISGARGSVEVTASEPYRVVRTDLPLGASPGSKDELGVVGGQTVFEEATCGDLDELAGAMRAALGPLRTAYRLERWLTLRPGKMTGTCGVDGICTARAPVRNRVLSPGRSTKVEVTMKVTMSARGLGVRNCSPPKVLMKPNSSESMSCSARFDVPVSRVAQSYPVSVRAVVRGVAKVQPDSARILAKMEHDFADLADEFGN